MVAQEEGDCVVCNDLPSNRDDSMPESKFDEEKHDLPAPEKDSSVKFKMSETEERQFSKSTRKKCIESEVICNSLLEDELEGKKKKTKNFKPAPDLLRHTAVDFLPAKLGLRCCEECGHCAAYYSTKLGVNWLEGSDWYCPWHLEWRGDDTKVLEEAEGIYVDWDEIEVLADEWDERIPRAGRCALGLTGVKRIKRSNKTTRAQSLAKEKQHGSRSNLLQNEARSPAREARGKHDVISRGKAREERLAEAIAAKKANIEDRLRRNNCRRRGPHPSASHTHPEQTRSRSAKTKRVKFELKEEDVTQFAASDGEAELLKVLALLQHRDLLPEDYDLLLRLDEKVSKRTVGSKRLRNLRTKLLTDADVSDKGNSDFVGARCAVCMDCYCADQVVKWLPCQHIFHSNCIDTWLGNAGSVCPLDGLEV